MKLTFQGDSLAEIHQQIVAAADELTREDVKTDNVFTPPASDKTTGVNVSPIVNAFEGVDWAKPGTDKTVEQEVHPEVQGAPTTKLSKIDGYNVSDGKVWVPVEGRGSSYSGVEIDEYHRRKAAKESGGELDAAGTPYNPAIHTSTRTKTNKGLWKNRPGGGAAKTAETTEPREVVHKITPSGDVKLEWQTATTEPAKPASVQEVVAHEDSAPPIGRAPSMHNYESFKTNLMTIVVRLINENKITRDYMKDLNAYFQVSNLWDVKNDDTKCQQLFKLFLEYQFIMGA